MKWIKTKSETQNQTFELWDDNIKSLTFSTSLPGFAKIQCNDTRRTFMIEKKGIFRSRIILRNEYGIRLGQVTYEGNHSNEGLVEWEGQRLRYKIQNQSTPELVVYKPTNEPLLICELSGITNTSYNLPKSTSDDIYPALLLALCWHHYSKVLKPEIEFAL